MFWVTTQCSLVGSYRHFGGTQCLHIVLQGWRPCVTPKHWCSPTGLHDFTIQKTHIMQAVNKLRVNKTSFKQEILGRTNRLLSCDTTRTAWKTMPLIILHCRENVSTELLPSNDRGIHRPTDTRPTILLLLRLFVAAVTFLSSRCLPTIEGIHRLMGGFMKYAVEMGSGAIIYVHTKFRYDWFRHSKVNREGFTDTQTALRSHKPTFIFSKQG
jgi:hypothetical protein